MSDSQVRDAIAMIGRSLYDRGLTPGSSGNISVKVDDGWLMTPTNACLGRLDPAKLSKLDFDGKLVSGDKPTKESFLHMAMYAKRNGASAVVHLHSTSSVAVSVLDGLNKDDVLPPLTAYYVMRVGRLPLIPYFPPGDKTLADAVGAQAGKHHAVLLANHGPVVAGTSLENATYAIEELEETAKLFLLLANKATCPLTAAQADALRTPS